MRSFSRYLPWLGTLPVAGLLWSVSPALTGASLLLFALGIQDLLQTTHAIRRNYPLTGRLRYGLESIRVEIRQYFLEDDDLKIPFSRNERAIVYARSKVQNDKRAFGSIKDMYANGAEWLTHSFAPQTPDTSALRISVGRSAGRKSARVRNAPRSGAASATSARITRRIRWKWVKVWRTVPISRQGPGRGSVPPAPSQSLPQKPSMPPSSPRAGRWSTSQAPSGRCASQSLPWRCGFSGFFALRGRLAAMPSARARQGSRQGQRPQAGLRGVQIVAPRSITACA